MILIFLTALVSFAILGFLFGHSTLNSTGFLVCLGLLVLSLVSTGRDRKPD